MKMSLSLLKYVLWGNLKPAVIISEQSPSLDCKVISSWHFLLPSEQSCLWSRYSLPLNINYDSAGSLSSFCFVLDSDVVSCKISKKQKQKDNNNWPYCKLLDLRCLHKGSKINLKNTKIIVALMKPYLQADFLFYDTSHLCFSLFFCKSRWFTCSLTHRKIDSV